MALQLCLMGCEHLFTQGLGAAKEQRMVPIFFAATLDRS